MPNSAQNVEECDATGFYSSNAAGSTIKTILSFAAINKFVASKRKGKQKNNSLEITGCKRKTKNDKPFRYFCHPN